MNYNKIALFTMLAISSIIIKAEDDATKQIKPQQAAIIGDALEAVLQTTDHLLTQTPAHPMSTGAQHFFNGLHAANTALLETVEVAESLINDYIDISQQLQAAK